MLPTNFDLHDHRIIPFLLPFLPGSQVTLSLWLPVFIFLCKIPDTFTSIPLVSGGPNNTPEMQPFQEQGIRDNLMTMTIVTGFLDG
jgi:hypothetical protein